MPGEDESAERPVIGRPRPEPAELMTARQLVYAYVEARCPEDRQYALEETEAFLDTLGDDADSAALIVLLGLPSIDETWRLLAEVEARLIERTPAVVQSLLRVSAEGDKPACDNAAAVLDRTPAADLALGFAHVLRAENGIRLKRAAASGLVALGQEAASQILDALGDLEIRDWISEAAGCPLDATDAQVMTMIVCGDDAQGERETTARPGGAKRSAPELRGDDLEAEFRREIDAHEVHRRREPGTDEP
jgi:hypothetical protein